MLKKKTKKQNYEDVLRKLSYKPHLNFKTQKNSSKIRLYYWHLYANSRI